LEPLGTVTAFRLFASVPPGSITEEDDVVDSAALAVATTEGGGVDEPAAADLSVETVQRTQDGFGSLHLKEGII